MDIKISALFFANIVTLCLMIVSAMNDGLYLIYMLLENDSAGTNINKEATMNIYCYIILNKDGA